MEATILKSQFFLTCDEKLARLKDLKGVWSTLAFIKQDGENNDVPWQYDEGKE